MQEQQVSLKDIDFKYYFHHYLRLFWKWKWFIIIVGPLMGAIALFGVLQMGMLKYPPLPATVYIGVQSPKSKTFDDFTETGLNKERLILNRTFLENVVKKLSLQLTISGHSRYEIFDSLHVDSIALLGSYRFEINKKNKNEYAILFSNRIMNIKNKVIESGTFSSLERLNFSGIYCDFSQTFLENPHNFSFSVSPSRYAVDRILNKLKVTSPDPREQINYFSATLESNDYPLLAQTLNAIADMFVEKNTAIQKKALKETIVELEKQLSAAEQQLSKSKSELRNFLANNPSAGISQSTQQTMSELISLETGSTETNNLIEELQNLKRKYYNSSKIEQSQVISEMIVFLQTHGSFAAPSLQANLTQYTQEKDVASQNYAKSHPIFAEIEGKFASLNTRTIQAIDSYIIQLKKSIADRNSSIQKFTSKLRGLPSQELRFAELQKRQDIDSDIYSKLLSKYNEAKVSESVGGADVFIMEYAAQPIAPSRLIQFAKSAGIIFAVMLLFAFGPAIGMDLIDKTARSEQALTRMLPYRFLETIPIIKVSKSQNQWTPKNSEQKVQVSEILITMPGIQPPSAIELFRSLTTKVLLDYYDVHDRCFVVTSYEMDEGKSTVAANMAVALAQNGVKTVIIDCDIRRGVIHKILNLKKAPGLTEYLYDVSKATHSSSVPLPIQPTEIPNLWAIPSGTFDENPPRLLRSPALSALKAQLIQESFFVVIDSPPVAVAADSAILNNLTSKYILVVRSGKTNVVNLRKLLKKDYPMIDSKVLGVILNMGENTVPKRYYSYYYDNTKRRSRSD